MMIDTTHYYLYNICILLKLKLQFRDKTERRIEWLNDKMHDTGENTKQADNLIQELENFAKDWQVR